MKFDFHSAKLVLLRYLLILLFHCGICSNLLSQKTINFDSTNADELNNAAFGLSFVHPDSAILLSEKALEISKNAMYEEGMFQAYINLGISYYKLNIYNKAISNFNLAISAATNYGNQMHLAIANSNMAMVFNAMGDYNRSMMYDFKAIQFRENIADTPGLAKSYNSIGINYHKMSNYEQARKYYYKSKKLKSSIGDSLGLASTLNNLGEMFYDLSVKKNNGILLDSAIANLNCALSIRKRIHDKAGIAASFINLGNIALHKNDLKSATEFYKLAFNYHNEIKDTAGMALLSYNIGLIYFKQGLTLPALFFFLKSKELSNSLQNIELIKKNLRMLAEVYARTRNYQKSCDYYSQYASISDSINLAVSNEEISQIQARYEYQKTVNQNLENDAQIKQLQLSHARFAYIMFLVLVIVTITIGINIYISLRRKRNMNNLLSEQNEELEQSREIIFDSLKYARTIQKAVLLPNRKFKDIFHESFVFSKPKDIIGGDFLWYKKIGTKKYFALIDCTGHGVPGAFMSIISNTLLNRIVDEEHVCDLVQIVTMLDQNINIALDAKRDKGIVDGLDLALCSYDGNKLEYVGARMPLIHIRNGEITHYDGDKHTLGGTLPLYSKTYTLKTIDVEQGDMIYVFSDGYVDQFGGPHEKSLKIKPFKQILQNIHQQSMSSQRLYLKDFLQQWMGSCNQVDDIFVVGVRF
jgi:serine phosphatase RsbU (regulator of sigma subunit)